MSVLNPTKNAGHPHCKSLHSDQYGEKTADTFAKKKESYYKFGLGTRHSWKEDWTRT